jgi:ribonucleoside-diphosphate reductase alpha chain
MVKVVQATILGTLQSTLTDLRYVRPIWKLNTEEERLLGVSLTGIMDHPVLSQPSDKTRDWLDQLRLLAVSTNKKWAKKLGVEQSTAITCVKPSGTVSQLVDSASGIHARFAEHYIRRVRSDIKDPLTTMMIDQGVPHEVDVTNPSTVVFSFPQKVAEGAVVVADLDVKAQLDLWEVYQDHWCEHKPSVTIYYYDSEFLAAGQWVWDKLEKCSGISFLPRSDHIYAQAPYEEIDSKEYNKLIKQMPSIDWTKLGDYETIDMTTATQELSCTAGLCDI